MSGGYTPIFASVFEGSLTGKWPQTGVWLALLAMADRHGHIDKVPQKIASDMGIEQTTLLACIAEFCAPDPMSRSRECEGRRLELIEVDRPWGWRVINHAKYRDKARKAGFDAARAANGSNAERMKARREDPTRPDATRRDPPSDSYTDTDSDSDSEKTMTVPQSGTAGAVETVFEHWRTTHGHDRARLDAKRRKLIHTALAGYSEADLCQAISGYANSPHHMGQNDKATKYDDLEVFLRDSKHIEAGLKFYAAPPRTDLSDKTRRIISQTETWVPPESRNAS